MVGDLKYRLPQGYPACEVLGCGARADFRHLMASTTDGTPLAGGGVYLCSKHYIAQLDDPKFLEVHPLQSRDRWAGRSS